MINVQFLAPEFKPRISRGRAQRLWLITLQALRDIAHD
jgi:hypothetical protein